MMYLNLFSPNTEEINRLRFIMTKQLNKNDWKGDILDHPKCLLWWLQAYLAKTSDICIGLRDQNGIVCTPVQVTRAEQIAKVKILIVIFCFQIIYILLTFQNRKWKPHVCIRFLHSVLKLVEKTMAQVDCPYTVYEFDSSTRCIKFKVHAGKTDLSFLSDDYIKKCKQRTSH